jgi:hypothetical protein
MRKRATKHLSVRMDTIRRLGIHELTNIVGGADSADCSGPSHVAVVRPIKAGGS